jgi:Domain of unknown function (DUF4917)
MPPEIIHFDQAIEMSKNDAERNLLLGNGFSIARGGGIFSYSNLLEKSELPEDSPIRNVFRLLNTVDFEEVMRALEHASKIEEAYSDVEKSLQFSKDAEAVREALIKAVRAVHPEVHFEIPAEQVDCCSNFLNNFSSVFSLNYDLLMYWVIIKSNLRVKFRDGFAYGEEIDGFRTFSQATNPTVYHLHGALHLFQGDGGETKKRIRTNSRIIDDIASTIRNKRTLPLFVAEGTSIQKMRKINSIEYLRYCYDLLRKISRSIFVFGHSAASNDNHIYSAMLAARDLKNLYFCVYDPSKDWSKLRRRLEDLTGVRKDLQIHYVDSSTAKVWNEIP